MDQHNLNNQLYELLIEIKDSSNVVIKNNLSENEGNKYKYLCKLELVYGLQIDYYYDGYSIDASQAIITEKGYQFIEEVNQTKKPIRKDEKNRYEQVQVLLRRIENGDINFNSPNPRVKKNDHFELLDYIIELDLVRGIIAPTGVNKMYFANPKDINITVEGYEYLTTPYNQSNSSQKSTQNVGGKHMGYLTKERKIKDMLKQLYDIGKLIPNELEVSNENFASILKAASKEGYINNVKLKATKSGTIITCGEAEITKKGVEFLYPEERPIVSNNTYNIQGGNFNGASLGPDSKVINNREHINDD